MSACDLPRIRGVRHDNARLKLADLVLRRGFRGAMDYLLMRAQFPDHDAFEQKRANTSASARCRSCRHCWSS